MLDKDIFLDIPAKYYEEEYLKSVREQRSNGNDRQPEEYFYALIKNNQECILNIKE